MWIVHCGAWTLAPLSIFLLDKILWHPTHLSVMWLCHIILKTFIRPKVNFLLMESKQVNLLCWSFSTVCVVLALSFDVGVFFWWGGFETISEPQKSLSALWATHFSRQLLDHVLLDLELGNLYSCFCTPWCFVEKMTKVSLAHWQEREVLCLVWCFSSSLGQEVGSFAAALLFSALVC